MDNGDNNIVTTDADANPALDRALALPTRFVPRPDATYQKSPTLPEHFAAHVVAEALTSMETLARSSGAENVTRMLHADAARWKEISTQYQLAWRCERFVTKDGVEGIETPILDLSSTMGQK